MKNFIITPIFEKKWLVLLLIGLKSIPKKQVLVGGFLLVLTLFSLVHALFKQQKLGLKNASSIMGSYGEQLQINLHSTGTDSLILDKERALLLRGIEEQLVTYLYRIPDYSYIPSLESYLAYAPAILEQIPSTVPLEKGDYWLLSDYGIRKHPISQDVKKHFGIDLAAVTDTHVHASATGTVLSVTHAKEGYGTHIIIEHRFGFRTLYGHLNKVLVSKGQDIAQHDLIGTVGTTGSTTGAHLHYEIIKNGLKIDPMYSLQLKQTIYKKLFQKMD